MTNRPWKRRVRASDSKWQIRVNKPCGLSDHAVFEARAVAEEMGDREALLGLVYSARATSLGGEELHATGVTEGEAVSNAVREIKMFTGYSDDDLTIEMV